MNIGIVGHDESKFGVSARIEALRVIEQDVLIPVIRRHGRANVCVVSGGYHLGGVDIWAKEVAEQMHIKTRIFRPETLTWRTGFKPRNLQIVAVSDVVHCIVVDYYPGDCAGMKFEWCYHCKAHNHKKSGACWTAQQAEKLGKRAVWHIIEQ